MNAGNPLIPDWSRYKGSLLQLPGIQALLRQEDLRGIEPPGGLDGFTWVCCGLYEASIGAGGLVAEEPVDPTLEPAGILHPIEQPSPPEGLDDVIDEALFNFLAWRLYTPVKAPGGSCIEYGGSVFSLVTVEPWGSATPTGCLKPRRVDRSSIDLGAARMHAEATLAAGPLRVYETREGFGVCGPRGCVFEASSLEIELKALDYRVHLLYPLHYRPVARVRPGRRVTVRTLSMVIETPLGSIALSSSRSFTALLESGGVVVEPEGSLRVAKGSEAIAYRILVEDAAVFRLHKAPRSIGHARPGSAAGVLTSVGRGLAFAVANSSYRDSMFEARIRLPVGEVNVESLLDEIVIPAPDGLARIPAPRGFAAIVKATPRRRLRFKRMPQGGAEAASL